MDVCNEYLQTQLALASGISSWPPAGIMLIQHPGREGASAVNLFSCF